MGINEAFGWNRGANREAADRALENGWSLGDDINLGPRQLLHGANEEDVRNILRTRLQKANDQKLGTAALEAGLTPFKGGSFSNYGEGTQQFAARIREAQEKKDEANRVKLKAEKDAQRKVDHQNNLDIGRQSITAQNDQFAFSERVGNERRAHERRENELNRRQDRELADNSNSLTMQMSVMQNDLADRRMEYDKETRRLDKRQQAIATLMSGLGSLGGAFTL